MKDRLIICHRNSLSGGTIFKNNIEKLIFRLYQTLSRSFLSTFNGFKLAYQNVTLVNNRGTIKY